MLQLKLVSKSYGGQKLLEEVSLCVSHGERCALVGRNGAGKSTLLRMIAGEEELDGGAIMIPKGYRIGFLHQHLGVTESTVIDEAALGLPQDGPEHRHRVEALLFGLGFTKDDLYCHPDTFSGGYLIRIHLAKLLASEPDCLLLDEPTNYLDIVSLRWLVRFLQRWKGEMIVISHDRELLDMISTHTVGIHRRELKKVEGDTEEYYSQILLEEEVYEKTRVKTEKKKAHMQSFVDRYGAKASKAGQAQSRVKAMSRMPVLEQLAALQHLDFKFRFAPFNSQKVLTATDIGFAYPEMYERIVDQFSILVERQEKIALIGKNGKGKSTLLQLLGGLLMPQEGVVKIADNVRLGYFGQTHIDRLNLAKSVHEEISTANPHLNYSSVRAICGAMMFPGDAAEKKVSVLSGGERSRVLLGKILASPCNLLLLDEPTNHLDMESVEALATAIEIFEGAVIFVTHAEWMLRRLPTRLVICQDLDKLVFEGSYDDFLEKIGWEEGKPAAATKKPSKRLPAKADAEAAKLRKRMADLEKQISEVEVAMEACTSKLVEASHTHNASSMGALSKELDLLQVKLDLFYQEYEKAEKSIDTLS